MFFQILFGFYSRKVSGNPVTDQRIQYHNKRVGAFFNQ